MDNTTKNNKSLHKLIIAGCPTTSRGSTEEEEDDNLDVTFCVKKTGGATADESLTNVTETDSSWLPGDDSLFLFDDAEDDGNLFAAAELRGVAQKDDDDFIAGRGKSESNSSTAATSSSTTESERSGTSGGNRQRGGSRRRSSSRQRQPRRNNNNDNSRESSSKDADEAKAARRRRKNGGSCSVVFTPKQPDGDTTPADLPSFLLMSSGRKTGGDPHLDVTQRTVTTADGTVSDMHLLSNAKVPGAKKQTASSSKSEDQSRSDPSSLLFKSRWSGNRGKYVGLPKDDDDKNNNNEGSTRRAGRGLLLGLSSSVSRRGRGGDQNNDA